MKANFSLYIIAIFSLLLPACRPSASNPSASPRLLTTERARQAINQFAGSGTATFLGVQESPGTNSATAELKMQDVPIKMHGETKIFTGSGLALFTHFTDGRWVLTGVRIAGGGWAYTAELNIEVK